jgi:hypothetical protein
LGLLNQPWETPAFPWPFSMPEKEANATQTTAEYIKLTTSFIGNFTAFQAYMDGFSLEGMHPAAHIVRHFGIANYFFFADDADCALSTEPGW